MNDVNWPDRLFDVIKRSDVRQIGYVPDAGHSRLIERCRNDRGMHAVSMTKE